MRNITKTILGITLMTLTTINLYAYSYPWQPQGEQSTCTNYYITSNAGWSNSEYYKILDIDAAILTDAALPKFTAADGAKNALDADFKSGIFTTPVMTTTDGTTYTPTNVLWPVIYHMAAFAPTMYNSAYTKMNVLGSNPSGSTCYANNNTVKTSGIWDKQGFIELSRIHKATATYPKDSLGYIEIDSLPAVERIQWSYSATSYKRGVKMDINYHDGNGWTPRRWVASDYNNYEGSFAEQGYQFEEIIGQGMNNGTDNPLTYISLRIRIWDGDSIHFKVNANDLSEQTNLYTATMKPTAYQTVRVHQIKVYSGIIPNQAPGSVSAIKNINADAIKIRLTDNKIVISETAQIEIYSYDGKRIFNGLSNNIDVSGYSKGIYIVQAVGVNGRTIRKIVL